MEAFLLRWGLAAVFAGAMLEGDVTMILAGVTSHLGYVSLPGAAFVGALGAFVADLACYAAGRSRSASIRATRLYRRAAPAIEGFRRRLGPWQILVSRFVYGTRMATMFFWGVHGLPGWKFGLFDLAGCALWAVVMTGLGYGVSNSAEAIIGEVRRLEMWLLGALIIGAALIATLHFASRRIRRRGAAPVNR